MITSRRAGAALAALALLSFSACADPGLNRPAGGVFAPGVAPRGAEADPLETGHRLMAAGQYQLALDAYLRAAARDGLTADTLAGLGSANLRLGRLGQAEALLRKAVEEDPMFVPAWNNLGVLLMDQAKYAEASEVFRRAYAADSGNSDTIRDNLRRSLARMDDALYTGPSNEDGGRVIFNDVPGGAQLIGVGDSQALSPEQALQELEPL